MSQYFIFGEVIVSREELIARTAGPGTNSELLSRIVQGRDVREDLHFEFSGGRVTAATFVAPCEGGFKPVGPGLPALVMIRHVYTGNLPRHGQKEMLLTSAAKDIISSNAAPRALNFLTPKVSARSNFISPAPTAQGTPIIFYSPAVISASTALAFDFFFNDFDNDLVQKIAELFTNASGLPVFGPYSGILFGAATAIKLAGNLAESLIDNGPDYTLTDTLEYEIPGVPVPLPGYRILCSPELDLSQYDFKLGQGLVSKSTGKPYAGDYPYIVYLVDGSKSDAFKDFTPTAVAASVLSRFYAQKDGSEVAIDTVLQGLRLYNDVRLRNEAKALQEKIDSLPADDPEREVLARKRKALLDNILEAALKPRP